MLLMYYHNQNRFFDKQNYKSQSKSYQKHAVIGEGKHPLTWLQPVNGKIQINLVICSLTSKRDNVRSYIRVDTHSLLFTTHVHILPSYGHTYTFIYVYMCLTFKLAHNNSGFDL